VLVAVTDGADPDRDHFVHLCVILDALDAQAAASALQALPFEGGKRLVGERWWRTQPGPPLWPLSVHHRFPHLDRGMLAKDEWIDDAIITAAFENLHRQGNLSVGICTLAGTSETVFAGTRSLDPERGTYGFRAASVSAGESGWSPSDELREVVQWVRDEGVHVLLLPELSVDTDGRCVLEEEITRNPGELRLIIPGSFHLSTGDSDAPWANTAPVWIVSRTPGGTHLVPVGEAGKREPFDMPATLPEKAPTFVRAVHQAAQDDPSADFGTLLEDIGGPGHVPFVATPFGVFSCLICKDALVTTGDPGDLPMRTLRAADHLALLAMNGSSASWFWGQAELGARQFFAATYFANAAQLVRLGDASTPLAFWLLPRPLTQPRPGQKVLPADRKAHRVAFFRAPLPTSAAPHRQSEKWPTDGRVLVRIPLEHVSGFTDDL
jgi:hypothetical protein